MNAKKKKVMSPAVSRYATLWLLLAQVMVALPVFDVLPATVLPLIALTLLWRVLIWFGRGFWPNVVIRIVLVACSFGLIITGLGWTFSLEMAVTVLVTGYALKMLEMVTRRDAMIVAFIGFFVTGAAGLYSQSLSQAAYLVLCIGVLVAAVHAIYSSPDQRSIKVSGRFAGLMVLQTLPLTIVLFVFVPRLGPLWAVTWPDSSKQTGLSDTLKPGDVASLSQSYELAFRAQFKGGMPLPDQRYWRALVFDQYNDGQWSQTKLDTVRRQYPDVVVSDSDWQVKKSSAVSWWQNQPDGYDYEILLEPSGSEWLPTLGPAASAIADSTLFRTMRIEAERPVFERKLYRPSSEQIDPVSVSMPAWLREVNTTLPDTGNEESRYFARQLFEESEGDPLVMGWSILKFFNQSTFYYTLSPPLMGRDEVDDFMFRYQKGFCEHYASSFVFMMRSVGVPARIVTGYQGGDLLPEDNVIRVLQRDAHAWAEIWVDGEGWIRFDPTTAVAPERVELGIDEMISRGRLEQTELPLAYHLRNTQVLKFLRNQWEGLEYRWQKSVIQYQEDTQEDYMRQLFGTAAYYWHQMTVLGGLMVIFLSLYGVFFLLSKKSALSVHQKLWLSLEKKLARKGYHREPGEGPAAFADRICLENPALGEKLKPVISRYIRSAYGKTDDLDKAEFQSLKSAISQI
ncbi:DUF3488 and transglutaminase-like domain-containing protein [uncultured Endozoicomonas sp.]|uniref:transglutaminase TgpA family protein n=1 Tax=uncultured Endozoicomonas sp. TaxID=432652 RepID=UPI0026258E69|nr:DUF3488 and transglutaminase-like domain-containing protein [uncultured Endozoicomonas sp.]